MKKKLHIHLDPIGGISGDMFISAMIDAEPSLKRKIKLISSKIIKDNRNYNRTYNHPTDTYNRTYNRNNTITCSKP